MKIIERAALDGLFEALQRRGYELIGPTVQDQAITYDRIERAADLPAGITDEQDGGHYRLRERTDDALFGYVVGPRAWKHYLFPPQQTLFTARRSDTGIDIERPPAESTPRAFIGVRPCELRAIEIQDRVFLGGPYEDLSYQRRREQVFIVTVQCAEAGGTCFCVSMDTGPRAATGFDLALTEIIEPDRHYFTVEAGSDAGWSIVTELNLADASSTEEDAAKAASHNAAAQMGRRLDTDGIRDLLYRNLEHPRWDEVADRCLSCANCTLVCPTCFCSTVEDRTDLEGGAAERARRWDSCFNVDFSYVAGGVIRDSVRSRYRQWMTHKLASWHDQFDSSGCVGCGRCITWCPVGIDITEEAAAIRASDGAGDGHVGEGGS